MSKLTNPAMGCFVVVYSEKGWIWPETLNHRARDSRRRMGEIMVGIGLAETPEAGWRHAKRNGYSVEKVDVYPAAENRRPTP